jgi:hypothetical protein
VAAEKAPLKSLTDPVITDVLNLHKLSESEKIKLPAELSDAIHDLVSAIPKDAEAIKDWIPQVYSKVKEARAHINGEKEFRKESTRESTRDLESTGLDEAGVGYHPNDQYFESKGEKRGKGEKKAKAPTTVDALHETIKTWFNPVWMKRALDKGWINVSENIQDTNLSDKIKADYDKSKGLYFGTDGSIYFFTDNIPKGNELGVILHEVGEHKGLDNLIGKDRVTMLANRVRSMANGQGGKLDVAIAKKAMKRIEGMTGEKANKELIAYFSEIAVNDHKIIPGGKSELRLGLQTYGTPSHQRWKNSTSMPKTLVHKT